MNENNSAKVYYCRQCGDVLVVGGNWTERCKLNSDRECQRCRTERTKKYRVENYSQYRSKAKLAARRWYLRNKDKLAESAYTKRRTPSHRFSIAKSQAKRRGVQWSLTKEEYARLVTMVCRYCGGPLCETGSGLDQVIPGGGYTLDNVVPCCGDCNTAKSDAFTYEEMLVIGASIRAVRESRIVVVAK